MHRALSSPHRAGRNDTHDTLDDLLATLNDTRLPLAQRRQAAWNLARLGSEEPMPALETALHGGPPYLQAAIAESLGHSPHPDARRILEDFLSSETNEIALRGAVRGIAARADEAAVETLHAQLESGVFPSVRGEAARALGRIDLPDAFDILVAAYDRLGTEDMDLRRDLLAGLGTRKVSETGDFFANVLADLESSTTLRVDVMEALEDAQGNVRPLLLEGLNDTSPDVRAAAVWSFASLEEVPQVATELSEALHTESDPWVRTRLYEALEEQDGVDLEALTPLVFHERDAEVRVAAAAFYATHLAGLPLDAPLRAGIEQSFDRQLVPELSDVALQAEDYGLRLQAVIALKKSRTHAAADALEWIAAESSDERISKAARRNR